MVASTIFSELWPSRVLIWPWEKKDISMESGGLNAHLWFSSKPEHYLGWPLLFLMAWVVPRLGTPGTWDGSLNTPGSSVLLRELRVQRRSACRIWNHNDSSWLWPLPPSWEIWLTSLLARAPSWVFVSVTNTHYAPGIFSLLGSKIIPSGEKPAEASVTHSKVKVMALCQVLTRQKPSVPGLERQIMKKTKNKHHSFWLSIISNVRFCRYISAIISPLPLLISTL